MSLSDGYRRLAALIDEIEGEGVVVTRSEPGREGTARAEGRLTATLTVEIPLDGGDTAATDPRPADQSVAEAEEAETTPSGTGSAEPGPAAKAPAAGTEEEPGGAVMSRELDGGPTADDEKPTSTAGPGDEEVPCEHPDCDETFGSEHGMRIHHSKTHRGEGTAPHRDPDQLRRVYDEHDTFAEMRDALGVPVASNTVRRQLIDHGIHDPSASDSDEDGTESGSEPASDEVSGAGAEDERRGRAVSDGGRAGGPVAARGDDESRAAEPSGPDVADDGRKDDTKAADELHCEITGGVTAAELRNALADASTVYDVQSALDLERDATMDLLSEVELLSVVHGRVATKRDRDEQRAEIDERIRSYVERTSE